MTSKIGQIRIPETSLEFTDNWSENLLLGPTSKLSIYAVPGTTFKLFQSRVSTYTTLVIGGTGLFSIDVDTNYITELFLSEQSYQNIEQSAHFVIIDYVYIAKEEEI